MQTQTPRQLPLPTCVAGPGCGGARRLMSTQGHALCERHARLASQPGGIRFGYGIRIQAVEVRP